MESWTRSWFQAHWAPSQLNTSSVFWGWPLRDVEAKASGRSFQCFGPENLTFSFLPIAFLAASGLTEGKRVRRSPLFWGRREKSFAASFTCDSVVGYQLQAEKNGLEVAFYRKKNSWNARADPDTCWSHRKCCWYRSLAQEGPRVDPKREWRHGFGWLLERPERLRCRSSWKTFFGTSIHCQGRKQAPEWCIVCYYFTVCSMHVDFSHYEEFREVSFVDPSVCDASNCCSGFVQQAP